MFLLNIRQSRYHVVVDKGSSREMDGEVECEAAGVNSVLKGVIGEGASHGALEKSTGRYGIMHFWGWVPPWGKGMEYLGSCPQLIMLWMLAHETRRDLKRHVDVSGPYIRAPQQPGNGVDSCTRHC